MLNLHITAKAITGKYEMFVFEHHRYFFKYPKTIKYQFTNRLSLFSMDKRWYHSPRQLPWQDDIKRWVTLNWMQKQRTYRRAVGLRPGVGR